MDTPDNSYLPPMIALGASGFISWLANVNWIGVIGLIVSVCWLCLTIIKTRWEFQDRKERQEKAKKGEVS